MKNDEHKNYYKTSDLALAAALSVSQSIEQIDKNNPRKAYFIFTQSTALTQLINQYWRKELKVEPQLFFQQIRFLKSQLYER